MKPPAQGTAETGQTKIASYQLESTPTYVALRTTDAEMDDWNYWRVGLVCLCELVVVEDPRGPRGW